MKTKKLISKILAWTMVFVLLTGMMPVGVFAEEPHNAPLNSANSEDIVLAVLGNPGDDFYLQIYEYGEITSGYQLVLPTEVEGFLPDGSSVTVEGVMWSSMPAFDPFEPGLYFFGPHLPAGYRFAEDGEPSLCFCSGRGCSTCRRLRSLPGLCS